MTSTPAARVQQWHARAHKSSSFMYIYVYFFRFDLTTRKRKISVRRSTDACFMVHHTSQHRITLSKQRPPKLGQCRFTTVGVVKTRIRYTG